MRNSKSRPGADCGSDHQPVVMDTHTKLKKIKKSTKSKRWDLTTLHMQREYFQQSIDNELTDYTHLNQESPNKVWESVKETINKVAEEVCGKVKPTSKQQWMTTEILEKMARRRQMQRGSHEHKQLSREIKEACRGAKENAFHRTV